MPLPTPNLDDRKFQDIVDAAKSLIPHYCPEWTDHNVSDPGVTLIELFAWMTDMLLYRVNQVPDKVYVKFLEMIGVRLEPPRPARAPITFYLSAAQPVDVTLADGTEVATVQTETSPAIVFTTETPLTIRPPELLGAFTSSRGEDGNPLWVTHDLRQLELPQQQITIFPEKPSQDDAFCLPFRRDHSRHVLAIVVDCQLAGGAGIDPNNPPLVWEAWQGGTSRWAPCKLEYDGTHGFNNSGEVIIHTPVMAEGELEGMNAYWIRCRLTEAQAGRGGYQVSPIVEQIQVEARGGTVDARHATTILNEALGTSDGTPGQSYTLMHTPVLARDPDRDVLLVDTGGLQPEVWREAADFADSGPDDKQYSLDSLDGTLTLGPSLLQPDGTVYRFGAVPPKGATLRFARYQFGGGVQGNVATGAISVLKSSIPYVARISNLEAATGGRDAQTLEDAMVRAPSVLRTRSRAVTVHDYECIAGEVAGVARAACLAPGTQPGEPTDPRPGQVFVIVLPEIDDPEGQLSIDMLRLPAELRANVLDRLNAVRPLGIAVEVREPEYVWVSVRATVLPAAYGSLAHREEVQRVAEEKLRQYLNPFTGGAWGAGWPFGRSLHLSEIYGLLQRVPLVDAVVDVQMDLIDANGTRRLNPTGLTVPVPRHGLICSVDHSVTVSDRVGS